MHCARSAEEALQLLPAVRPDVAVIDIVMPGMNGIELLSRIKDDSPDTEVVMMTSAASLETAIGAIRKGAYDYLQKPFDDLDEVWHTVRRALEKRRLTCNNRELLREQEMRNHELSRAVARLTSLIDAGRAMCDLLSLTELLDYFIRLVARELGVERASLMLVDEDAGELCMAASVGIDDPDVDNVRVRLGDGVAGTVAENGEPLLVTDTDSDPRVRKVANPDLSGSFISAPIVLSIPIKSRKQVLGVINVTNRRSGEPFDEEDLAYVSGLAGQLAVGIQNATQYGELRSTYESLKAAQQQLILSERIKAVGQMASGVAHDFNNVLSVIMARAQLAVTNLSRPEPDLVKLCANLRTIEEISLQGAAVIRRIQDYTRVRRDTPSTAVDLNGVLRDAVEMTRPKWKIESQARGRPIEVDFDLDAVNPVAGNKYELVQVIGNLIFNAVEAMPDGGGLTFRSANEGDWVVLEVADTGVGMNRETREKLFEPFFTTKEHGQGLGTSIVYGIVARHGGEITVDSGEGKGATFRVRLPRARDAAVSDEPVRKSMAGESRPVKILLVEDDELVRETYGEALTGSGHEVVAVADGIAALASFAGGGFDLVLTDYSMPGPSGLDVARGVKRQSPEVPVVLISGWAIQQEQTRIEDAGIDRIVAKPCALPELLEVVRQATAPGRESGS